MNAAPCRTTESACSRRFTFYLSITVFHQSLISDIQAPLKIGDVSPNCRAGRILAEEEARRLWTVDEKLQHAKEQIAKANAEAARWSGYLDRQSS